MPHRDDIPLTHQDVQTLSSADHLTEFFARLGYPAEERLPMTTEALQLPEKLADAVQRVELLTQVDDGVSVLQVYLFELTSVTVARTRALTRAFRDRSGNFLLVLTDDYARLDFVLLEREIPGLPGTGVATRAVSVVPRTLSVDRRDPGRVALRVLRRFTFTEYDRDGDPDTIAQYKKLKSAFAIAEWSQPYFNNRALFSDYYLTERLPETEAWQAPARNRAFRQVRALFAQVRPRLADEDIAAAPETLIRPMLKLLGFEIVSPSPPDSGGEGWGEGGQPDYLLHADDSDEPSAFVLAYPWNRYLDGKDTTRDRRRGESNPGALVVSLLEAGTAPWGIVTNGKLWRLYSAKAHSRATNYYEIDLEETLASPDPAEAFRYFYLFFRAEAYVPGMETPATTPARSDEVAFLDALLEESSTYARELGDRLKERVFERVFPHFAEGFIQAMGGPQALLDSPEGVRESRLETAFNSTLTFLYRLLFLLYAESRDLLPVRDVRGYYPISLQHLKEEIAAAAGPLEDQAPDKLKAAYSETSTALYDRLLALFTVIDKVSAKHNVPAYNGGLFLTDPDPHRDDLEAESARFLNQHKLPDRYLALGLDLIARDVDPKRGDLGLIDYKSLGVRQLGSIYEGLLEFKLRVAEEKMAVVAGKGAEQIIPYREAVDEDRNILTQGRGAAAQERILEPGTVYVQNDRRERKATGSYYTPDYIVKYIVRQTVGPVMDEKLDALRPRLRQVERDFHRLVQRKVEMENVAPDEPALLQANFGDDLHALFEIKILDPAMGSGHFLVEAVDYVTDRLVRFLDGFPFLATFFEGMRRAILDEMNRQNVVVDPHRLTDVTLLKRHVLKRCIYGVDLNPMAVELAKVSLWLDCFTLGAPLSFLDHHLRCGNSLIGAMGQELDEGDGDGPQMALFTGPFTGLLRAAEIMRGVSRLTDVTLEQVQESGKLFEAFDQQAKPFKQLLDLHVAQYFGVERAAEFLTSHSQDQALAMLKGQAEAPAVYQDALAQAQALYEEKRFFHWDLEFPEVFIDLEKTKWKDDGGFDAVIGNPPYDELSQEDLGREIDEKRYLEETLRFSSAMGYRINIYRLFILQAVELTKPDGWQSFIVPMSLLADRFTLDLRRLLLENMNFHRIEQFPQKDDSSDRVFLSAKLSTCLYVLQKSITEDNQVFVRTHPGRDILEESPSYRTAQAMFFEFDPENLSIPGVDNRAWNIIMKLSTYEGFQPLGVIARAVPGELMINRKFNPYLADKPNDDEIIRGSHIGMYEIVEPKQGDTLYLRREKYLSEHQNSKKAFHYKKRRVVYQRYAAIDNYRRLIATILPKNHFCSHTIGYLTEVSDRSLGFLVSLLNSKILDWRFNLTSTNNNINGYEVEALAIPCIHFTTPGTERERLTAELIGLYEQEVTGTSEVPVTWNPLLARVEALLPKDANGEFLAFKEGASEAEEKSDVVHDLLAHLAEEMIELNKAKQARVDSFWDELESVTAPADFDELRDRGKWEQSLAKDAACVPYVDAESRSTKHIDESLGWDEACFHAFAGMLIGKSSLTPKMTAVYREHHPPYKQLVAQIESTDALIDQVVYRLYGLTEEEVSVISEQ